jgi:hypothetical protein
MMVDWMIRCLGDLIANYRIAQSTNQSINRSSIDQSPTNQPINQSTNHEMIDV